jgi:DNA-binding SARP family transcriptional activator
VLLAASVFGAAFAADAVKKSRNTTELLGRLAASLVGSIDTEARGSLALAALFGFSHPRLFESVFGPRPVPEDPWLVPLSDDWSQVRTLWREPLLDLLRSQVTSSSGALTRLADVLLQQGMAEAAVPLYLQAGDVKGAIRALPRAVETLAAAGRWNAMARLVSELQSETGARHGGQAHWTVPSLVRVPAPHLRHRDIAHGTLDHGKRTPTEDGHPPLLDAGTSGLVPNRSTPSKRPMTAHLLGSFRVAIDDHAVERWTSGRGRTVLRFLLLHHPEAVHREILMDTFWPDASPEGARNNLNVAIHGLRQSLRAAAGDAEIVVHDRGRYLLSRDLVVWLDIAEFERLLSEAAAQEAGGDSPRAIASYGVATSLYSRGLFADDPYDDWATTRREHYRVMQIDALDRLARIYFAGGDHTACIRICQQILGLDCWREDTHCVLMRCFSRLGQPHLAIHQYRVCAADLGRELQVTPAPSTIELLEAVRLRQPI